MARGRKFVGEIVEVDVECVAVYAGAIGVWDGTMELNPHFSDGRKWRKHINVPKSEIENTDEEVMQMRVGKRFILCIPEWLAIERGLV